MPKTKQVTFSGSGITAVATYTFDADEIVVSGETIQLSPFWASSATVKLTVSGSGAIQASVGGNYTFQLLNGYKHKAFDALWNDGNWGSWSNGATRSMQITNKNSSTFSTRYFFDETNKTERRIPFTYSSKGHFAEAYNDSGSYYTGTAPHTLDLGQYLVLDAPPTFEATNLYYDGDTLYTGFSRVYCDISDCTAFYGGDIESATLKVGNQSATISGDGTVYIDLAVAGTFTPTVAVTDSRGQVTTKTLDAITVNGYIEPSLSLNVQRTTSTGVPNDEGTYGTMSATFTFTDVIAQLTQPTVEVDGTTASVTWYSTRATDGTLSGSVNWSSLTSPATVYGIVSAPNIQTSYQIEVTPNDSLSSGTPITQTLASAFYTIDFLAGGHGIAFGQPASQDGFECNMPTTFHDTVTMEDAVSVMDANSTLRALFDFIHPVGSYYETSDTSFDPNTTWGGTWSSETITDDVIVEEGTSGAWTYRKWSSGIAECWGTYSYTPTKWNAWGSLYEAIGSSYITSYPTGLFSERPLSVTAVRADSRGLLIETFTTGTKDHTDGHIGVRANSASLNAISFDVHAIGHWKAYTAPTETYRWHRTA